MSERISDTNNGTANSEARTPRFNRSKTVQVIISILVALALWVYVDVEKAPERTKTIRDVPVEFSGENTTLADKNLMLLSGYDTTIDLTIRGPKRELVKMSRDNVRVIASTSSIDSVGVHQLDWTVSLAQLTFSRSSRWARSVSTSGSSTTSPVKYPSATSPMT